jgi:hypothetical protein
MFVGNQINQGAVSAAANAVALDRVRNPIIWGNSFGRASLTTGSGTSGVHLGMNRWNGGSTYPTSGLTQIDPQSDRFGVYYGGTTPRAEFQASGWTEHQRVGIGYEGDALELASNIDPESSGTAGTLDNAAVGAMVLRLRYPLMRLYSASPGAGVRLYTEGLNYSASTSTLTVGRYIELAGVLPTYSIQSSGWTAKMRAGTTFAGDNLVLSSNLDPSSITTAALDDTGIGGTGLVVSSSALVYASATAGANPRALTEHLRVQADGMVKFNGHRMEWAAAIPVAGTWAQGDVVWNTGAAGGAAPGWVCTVAGTPGTWKAMANLAP